MDDLTLATTNIIGATDAAFRQAAALAVHYSFSIVGAMDPAVHRLAARLRDGTLGLCRAVAGTAGSTRRCAASSPRSCATRSWFSSTSRCSRSFGVRPPPSSPRSVPSVSPSVSRFRNAPNIAAGTCFSSCGRSGQESTSTPDRFSGTIQEIGAVRDGIENLRRALRLAPNSELWNKPVTNYTRNPVRMTEIAIGIGYDDDIDEAQQIYRDMAAAETRILDEPKPNAFVKELGDSAVVVSVRYWTKTSDWFSTKLDFTKAAKLAFDRSGISIPFPQQEVRFTAAEIEEETRQAMGGNVGTASASPCRRAPKGVSPSGRDVDVETDVEGGCGHRDLRRRD